MAAKPPKPPGNFLKQNTKTATSSSSTPATATTPTDDRATSATCSNNNSYHNITAIDTANGAHLPTPIIPNPIPNCVASKPTCNCTNISIMHLFHEMKQEFPTIPDPIVAQCVNENCHQRDNCIQVLRNELALNPIPAQTYPSKVLQRHHNQQNNKQQFQNHVSNPSGCPPKPPTPLKPLRSAPPAPSSPRIGASTGFRSCDSSGRSDAKAAADRDMPTNTPPTPITRTTTSRTSENSSISENETIGVPVPPPKHPARARPTTLNLQTPQEQQSLQRKQLHVQLQQHFQRNQQQKTTTSQPVKTLRKAPLPPLPPLPPKPTLNQNPNNSDNNCGTLYSHQGSCSNDSSVLTSPNSSCSESEISVNVSLSSPTSVPQQKSPMRHRSVINVQPEPPYARDFPSVSPTGAAGTPTGSCGSTVGLNGGNQKSFTSVNLTLRQPNSAAAPSTIDISAGPGLSGIGGGLTYSSSSYDARRGYQKNFHITVTDEGGVFSTSRIRPRGGYTSTGEEQDGLHNGSRGGQSNVLQQQQLLQYPGTQSTNHRLAEQERNSSEMCVPHETQDITNVIERQKTRRDRLATALRDNKKRLFQVEQDIDVLRRPIKPDEVESLDCEIQILRFNCTEMLNETARRTDAAASHRPMVNSTPLPHPQQRPPMASAQSQLDFIQNHIPMTTSAPSVAQTPPGAANTATTCTSPPPYHQYNHRNQQPLTPSQSLPLTDEEEYSDSNTDGCVDGDEDDDDEEHLEMWACNMCTVLNHPQLNICECCDNVRILPGRLRIVSAALPASVDNGAAESPIVNSSETSPAGAGNAENDANLTQQQLQQFALHT